MGLRLLDHQQLCLRVANVTGLPLGTNHRHALQELVLQADGTFRVHVPYRDGEPVYPSAVPGPHARGEGEHAEQTQLAWF